MSRELLFSIPVERTDSSSYIKDDGLVRRHIEEAKRRKSQPALYGARITGGGSGGTVCILGAASEEAEQAVAQIAASYRDATKHSPIVFSGSSSGSELFGALTLQKHAASP